MESKVHSSALMQVRMGSVTVVAIRSTMPFLPKCPRRARAAHIWSREPQLLHVPPQSFGSAVLWQPSTRRSVSGGTELGGIATAARRANYLAFTVWAGSASFCCRRPTSRSVIGAERNAAGARRCAPSRLRKGGVGSAHSGSCCRYGARHQRCENGIGCRAMVVVEVVVEAFGRGLSTPPRDRSRDAHRFRQ